MEFLKLISILFLFTFTLTAHAKPVVEFGLGAGESEYEFDEEFKFTGVGGYVASGYEWGIFQIKLLYAFKNRNLDGIFDSNPEDNEQKVGLGAAAIGFNFGRWLVLDVGYGYGEFTRITTNVLTDDETKMFAAGEAVTAGIGLYPLKIGKVRVGIQARGYEITSSKWKEKVVSGGSTTRTLNFTDVESRGYFGLISIIMDNK